MNTWSARGAIVLGLAVSGAAMAADDYPSHPVRMVVAFGPGTSTDLIARMLAERMSVNLKQPVIVENRAGAGGAIGTDAVAKAAPDGYTITLGTVGTHAINKTLYRKLPYDPVRDFTPVALVGYTPTLLVTRSDAPYGSVAQLVDYAHRNPGKVTFASAGSGTSGHLAGALLATMSNSDMLHVPYKEGAQAVTAVLSGETSFMFYHPTAVMPQVKAGRLKALASSAAKRSADLGTIPTVAEAGYPGFDLTAWFMIAAPKGIPAGVLSRLVQASTSALNDPALVKKLAEQGIEQSAIAQAELAAFTQTETAKWAKVIQAANAVID
jgi:tripartite-type tricarboxylate transporter receptor subunit TctC